MPRVENCDGLGVDFLMANEQYEANLSLRGNPYDMGWQDIEWTVFQSKFLLWRVESKEQIEIGFLNGGYLYITGATHNGSNLIPNIDCLLSLNWSENMQRFSPVPNANLVNFHTVSYIEGTLDAFGLSQYKKGSCLIHF